MKLNKKLLVTASDFSKSGFNTEPNRLYRLWFEFLKLSPSYELARRYREKKGRLSAKDKARLPADFDQVLKVFDDFGDVQRTFFKPWLLGQGLPLFGVPGDKPRTKTIVKLADRTDQRARAELEFSKYLFIDWESQGKPDVLVIAVPIHQKLTAARREINMKLKNFYVGKRERRTLPKYPLHSKGTHSRSLSVILDQLHVRAMYPEMKLWELGVFAGVSKTYSKLYGPDTKRTEKNYEDMRRIEMMTSRKLKLAKWIAENAARGRFPDKTQPEHSVEFDPNEFHDIFRSRLAWAKEARKEFEDSE